MFINKRILNHPARDKNTQKKLQYMHWLEMQKKNMVNLEKLMLREEHRIDEELTEIESDDGDKKKDDHNKIVEACPWASTSWVDLNLIIFVLE